MGNYWAPVITALAGVAVALFTLTLKWSTDRLWLLGRDEFIATHRPRLRVRYIDNLERDEGGPEKVAITVVNVGDTAASIVHFTIDVVCRDPASRDWLKPGLLGGVKPDRRLIATLACGEGVSIEAESRVPLSPFHEEAIKYAQAELCAVGIVIYRDDAGIERRTGFIWKRDEVSQKYRPLSPRREIEYSYED